jgi:methyltransferase (TIGR00027 family)
LSRSLIAGANAWFRAAESERRDPILIDKYAIHLADRDPRVQAVRFGRFVVPPLAREIEELQVAHCVRHAAIDRLVLDAIKDGYERVMIVGAGYDMRASRFSLRNVVEVDHPATQTRKIERLSSLDVTPVTRVAADLMADDLPPSREPTVFVLEGFLHYLSPHRFDALLAAMAASPRARIVASFIRTEMYVNADSLFVQLIKLVREIPRLHFTTEGLRERFARHGFANFRSWDAAGQIAELVPRARGRRIRLSQDVAVVERSR